MLSSPKVLCDFRLVCDPGTKRTLCKEPAGASAHRARPGRTRLHVRRRDGAAGAEEEQVHRLVGRGRLGLRAG